MRCKEETNLDIEIYDDKRYAETYMPKENVSKIVVYFMAKPITFDLKIEEKELDDVMWVIYEEAINLLTYNEVRNVWGKALNDLTK